jgi:integrase
MAVALHTGLRVGDVLALKTAQLAARFWITEAKTKKRRQVGLPAALLSDVMAGAGEVWAFPGRKPGKPRTRQAVWQDVKRAAKAARIPANAGPHSARKAYAVRLMQTTGDLERVKRALNHDNEVTTMAYALSDALRKKRRHRKKG